eukprot:CAMPEP_0114541616 /NCGR_PEP_ID=MMETSP0114-20121206/1399_1 /TAXON_ID=31324 /ORGANISM="Goniomonas sp, Strain m" /LENGTH=51 /DNA_ID=CAMNT_0001725863 /DNA_START=238 /DNA_END=393 /DNA_ORIENTATION=+
MVRSSQSTRPELDASEPASHNNTHKIKLFRLNGGKNWTPSGARNLSVITKT